jgi:Cof subfamily protein (haloacid dehalogenase superfamily)
MKHGAEVGLLVADVDGTLLTPDKTLTESAVHAVERLRAAGIEVALTSGRPPRGMEMLIAPLSITTPLAAFNGGAFVRPDLAVIEEHRLGPEPARAAAELIRGHGLDLWVYCGSEWYVRDPGAPHVAQEQGTVEFAPKVLDDLSSVLARAIKIVGVSDDHAAMARCEADAQQLGAGVSAARSQPYYLDITHRDANKAAVVRHLARALALSTDEIATIGDMPNDVPMFEASGLSIAMGNASPEVQGRAQYVTADNREEGFARAALEIVLPRAPAGRRKGSP